MKEKLKQITFAQVTENTIGQKTYRIKRLFNMHSCGLIIGATYPADEFKNRFANAESFKSVDIILE